jgi:leucine-rich repeat-containing G protein-coupled receptor 8
MVLWGRFTSRDENRSVSMVIRNLAVSDLIMGLYLAIISFQDLRYRENYHTVSSDWIKSWGCILAGVLSMVSSEVTILLLAFMSVERFLLISDPFGHHRLNTKNVMMSLYVIWLIGVSIAIFPVLMFHSSTKFYGIYNGGTCYPLFIQEKYPQGWEYSAFVFLGINLTLLLLIATLYTVLLFSIWRTRRQCATTLDFFDCEFAIRQAFHFHKQTFR